MLELKTYCGRSQRDHGVGKFEALRVVLARGNKQVLGVSLELTGEDTLLDNGNDGGMPEGQLGLETILK
jgi:hypothetical protein